MKYTFHVPKQLDDKTQKLLQYVVVDKNIYLLRKTAYQFPKSYK